MNYLYFILAIDQELEHEKRKEDDKNQLLQRKFPEMWKAIKWLRNCDKSTIFHGQVLEPLFTQVFYIKKNYLVLIIYLVFNYMFVKLIIIID